MKDIIKNRAPLTENEVLEYLNKEVEKTERQWGIDDFYTIMAKRKMTNLIEKYHAGEIIPVHVEEYADKYGNGTGNFADTLYSDGHVKTTCYGYVD